MDAQNSGETIVTNILLIENVTPALKINPCEEPVEIQSVEFETESEEDNSGSEQERPTKDANSEQRCTTIVSGNSFDCQSKSSDDENNNGTNDDNAINFQLQNETGVAVNNKVSDIVNQYELVLDVENSKSQSFGVSSVTEVNPSECFDERAKDLSRDDSINSLVEKRNKYLKVAEDKLPLKPADVKNQSLYSGEEDLTNCSYFQTKVEGAIGTSVTKNIDYPISSDVVFKTYRQTSNRVQIVIGNDIQEKITNKEAFNKGLDFADLSKFDYNGNRTLTERIKNIVWSPVVASIHSSFSEGLEQRGYCNIKKDALETSKQFDKQQVLDTFAPLAENRGKIFLISGSRRHSVGSLREYQGMSAIETCYLKNKTPSIITADGKTWDIRRKQKEVKRVAQLSVYSRSKDSILPNIYKLFDNSPYTEYISPRTIENRPPDVNQTFLYEYRVGLKNLLEADTVQNIKDIEVMTSTPKNEESKFRPLAAKICRLCGVRSKHFVCVGQNVIIKLVAVNLPVIIIERDRLRIGLCQTCDKHLAICSSFMAPFFSEYQDFDRYLNTDNRCFTCNRWNRDQLEEADESTMRKLALIFEAFPSDFFAFYGGKRFLCIECWHGLELLEKMQERICLTNKIFEDVYNGLYDTEIYSVYGQGTAGLLPPPPNNSPLAERKSSLDKSISHLSMRTMADSESEYMDEVASKPEIFKKACSRIFRRFLGKNPHPHYKYPKRSTKKIKQEVPGIFEVITSPITDPVRAVRKSLSTRRRMRPADAVPMADIKLIASAAFRQGSPNDQSKSPTRPLLDVSGQSQQSSQSLTRSASERVGASKNCGPYGQPSTSFISNIQYWTPEEMKNYFMD